MTTLPKILRFTLSLIALLVVTQLLGLLPFLQRWDNAFYDIESAVFTSPADDNIVIVAIDDASLQKLGRWPWSRAVHARMLNALNSAGVAAIGIDILFMEADNAHPEDDKQLVDAIRHNGRVILPVLTDDSQGGLALMRPLPAMADAAAGLAHVNMHFDDQGVVRRLEPWLALADGGRLPAMAVALTDMTQGGALSMNPGPVLMTFAGPPGHFTLLSFADVLNDAALRAGLRGKTVLIGVTAAGLGRRIATPVSKQDQLMSGIEFQANALSAVRSGKLVQTLSWPSHSLLSLLLLAIPLFLYPRLKPRVALLTMFVFAVLSCGISFLLLNFLQLWFAPAPTLLALLLSYPLWNVGRLEQLKGLLFREHAKAGATLNAIEDAVITTDENGLIEFMNPAAERMLASSLSDALGKPFSGVCRFDEEKNDIRLLRNEPSLGESEKQETHFIRNQQGEEYIVRLSETPLASENGVSAGTVYVLNDITQLINIHRKVAFVAAHDALTGLPNRLLLQDRLQQAINAASRSKLNFALLYVDLDGFKKINDAMGHACGDLLLQEVAKRLRCWARQSDTIARWGGDEFVILLENMTSTPNAAEVAGKVLSSLSKPFLLEGTEVFVTPSVGISLFPQDGDKSEVLLAKADAAMYSVKKNGRNNFCFFSSELESLAKEKLIMEKELHYALEEEQFEIHYQPQIDLFSGELVGVEALIRWHHPKKGLIRPDEFIPLAEESGLIVPIGEWIIKTVCRQIQSWENSQFASPRVAINLSARQFMQKGLVEVLTREIQHYQVDVDKIQVEITESMIIQDIERVIEILDSLKGSGISIAIDDFGTGFSSLEYLKRFPIDKLKIDKSFVNTVMQNNDDSSIVQAVINLGHNMNMQIIAEGVENEDQLGFLRDCKCDYGQGFYFSKPVTAPEMDGVLKRFSPVKKGTASVN